LINLAQMSSKSERRGKGGKYRKNKKSNGISQEDIDYLVARTSYDAAEINEWYNGFIEDNPSGQMSKDKMMDMYASVLVGAKAKTFVDQIFQKFDSDNSGSIDFKEFMLATNMSGAENSEEKLRWAFKMYDKDGSGSIEIDEMVEIVGNLFELEGLSKDTALERATNTFKVLDVNGDGELNEDEFVEGCMQDKALADLLNAGHMM